MAIDSVLHTNQHSVDRVLNTGLPVVLVFWRKDAQPSVELDPLLAQLAAQYAGKALIAKIDAGEEAKLVGRYHVTQLPTLLFVHKGALVATAVGAGSAREIADWLEFLLNGGERPSLPSGPTVSVDGSGRSAAHSYTNGASRAHDAADQPSAQPASAEPVTLTDANFQQIIGAPGPVLVDFWAAWCGPCRMVAPAVEQLAAEFQGKAVVGKLNVDENPQTASRYRIMSIPALYIFKHGEVVDKIVGAQPAHVLRQRLAQHVG